MQNNSSSARGTLIHGDIFQTAAAGRFALHRNDARLTGIALRIRSRECRDRFRSRLAAGEQFQSIRTVSGVGHSAGPAMRAVPKS